MFLSGCLVVAVMAEAAVSYSEVYPTWQQFYPSRKWATYEEQIHGRPARIRTGSGLYRVLPTGAELLCDFPKSMALISNIVWERPDLGSKNNLDDLYRAFGLQQVFIVHSRSYGSTLHLLSVTPLDKGVYRCMVTALDPAKPHSKAVTLFQDVEFYPEL